MKKRNVMKKFFALAATAALCLSLAACSDPSAQNTQQSQNSDRIDHVRSLLSFSSILTPKASIRQ